MANIPERDARLYELLEVSETANGAFDRLIDSIAELIRDVGRYKAVALFDSTALLELGGKLECCIIASAHDDRVIAMCQSMLTLANIPSDELKIDNQGKVVRRQVYFARRADGLIKIGSSMKPLERLKQLSTGAAEDLDLLGHMDGSTAMERHFHSRFKSCQKHGEWFEPTTALRSFIQSMVGLRVPAKH